MNALILASYLATQTWAWGKSPEPDVVAYRIYYSPAMTVWCPPASVEIPASACDAVECQGEVPEPPFSPVFFLVTAVDSAGNESGTDHGDISQVCP